MPFRNKEDCLAEARRLGIEDAEQMTWPQLQKAVSEAVKLEELGALKEPAFHIKETTSPAVTEKVDGRSPEEKALDSYAGKTVVLSPELAPERYRLVKYDEVLGNDIEVEERKFDIDSNDQVYDISGGEVSHDNKVDAYHDYTTGTYRLKNRSERKVVAMSSVPKENPGMVFRPGMDYAPVVTWKGRSGYLWNHWRYPNIKGLLMASGYYQEYKHLFKDEPNMWYAAGVLVCDPHLVHQVFAEIEEKERRKQDEFNMRRDYYKGLR